MQNTPKTRRRFRVLLAEDDALDQMAFKRQVQAEKLPYDYEIAGSLAAARKALDCGEFDVMLADYYLGDGTAFDILQLSIDVPVIIATGAGDEEIAVKALKSGAYDYLIKDIDRNYLKVMPHIVENAVKHKEAEQALQRYHDELETLVKERTEELAAEKELLSVTVSSMSDGLICVDADRNIVLFNPVCERLTKYRAPEVYGKDIDEIVCFCDEKTRKPLKCPAVKALKSREIRHGTDRDVLVARDGTKTPISATASPIRREIDGVSENAGNRQVTGAVMILRDVSREREIDRLKTDFISSVSHELRTPLTSIKAYASTMLRDRNMPDDLRQNFLKTIDEESNVLKSLIDGLLDISRFEAGTVKMTHEPVDVEATIDRVISSLQPLADKKSIEIKKNVEPELARLLGDESRMRSLIRNLVHNAIKFSPSGGHVLVAAKCVADELIVTVSDYGVGIPKEYLPKIFDRFYRVNQPGKKTKGTGLGLAIVKDIVVMHQGRIDVESEPGKGTTFTIHLPLEPKNSEVPKP